MNGDEINEDTCKLAVAGGNLEIIHLCEQKGFQFEDCLFISSLFHRFDIFEWLNTHFEYEEIVLSEFIECCNEPLFYSYSLTGSNVEIEGEDGFTPINIASFYHRFDIFEWLNTHFNYKEIPLSDFIECYNEPLFYSYSLLGSNVEIKDKNDSTPINKASENGQLEVV